MKYTKFHWWMPKVLCLGAACAFWLYVMNEQNPIMRSTYTVPVEVRNLDRSLVAMNVPNSVRVDVSMNRNGLMRLRSDDIHAYVDLMNVTDGTYPNTKINVSVPETGEAVSVTPAYFDMVIDTYAVKSVPITVSFFGNLPEGYRAALQSVTPSDLTVAGSSSRVAAVDRAVASVNVTGKTESFSEFDSIAVMDGDGSTVTGIDVMPMQVQVSVAVTEEIKTANVPLSVRVTGQPAEGFTAGRPMIRPAAATVTGPESRLRNLKNIPLGEIDVTDASADVTAQLPLVLPEGVESAIQDVLVTVPVGEGTPAEPAGNDRVRWDISIEP